MALEKPPVSIFELAAALMALGAYRGINSEAEHAEEAERLGYHPDFYRVLMANSLLGVAEKEAMKARTDAGPEDGVAISHHEALWAAGATGSNADFAQFLRWRALRISLPLERAVKEGSTGAIPLAAAWAAEALQLLLGILADAQQFTPDTLPAAAVAAGLQEARSALSAALEDIDLLLGYVVAEE
jgi:hypothetical protein